MARKKALLLGGTGALGVYLAPQLVEDGFDVTITSRSSRPDIKNIHFLKGDARDKRFTSDILKTTKFDVVVDFMIYSTAEFAERYNFFLENCTQYIFISSYRVFSEAKIITERSKHLLDVSKDSVFLKTTDYSLEKARQENILRAADKKNWTIVRPSITYSKERFQLGTLEADTVVGRSLEGKPVVLPAKMLDKQTTMTWAGDVAKMISALATNKEAFGEDFNVVTSEHHSWSEVAEIYKDIIGLKLIPINESDFLDVMGGGYAVYQINYDRMFNRLLDNSKILKVTGLRQEQLMTLKEGLNKELSGLLTNRTSFIKDYAKEAKMDRLVGTISSIKGASVADTKIYLKERFPKLANKIIRVNKIKRAIRLRTRAKEATIKIKQKTRIRTRIKNVKEQIRLKRRRLLFAELHGGIITLIDYNNYGNILQRYALQEFLLRNKYAFVSYEHSLPIINDLSDGRVRFTAEFTRRYIFTDPLPEKYTLKNYIVGSDQIWRDFSYEKPKEQLGFFFLNFLKNNKHKRIAYAASFGRNSLEDAKITPELSAYIRPYVQKFSAISVREKSAKNIVRDAWGVDARVVIDPTMLLPVDVYSGLIDGSIQKIGPTGGVFAYLIGVSDSNENLLQKAADYTGKGIYRIDLADYSGPLPPVEQWLKGLRDAEFAVVDSFHGAVFSIINNTNFIVLENKGSGLERMIALLELFGIKNRILMHEEVADFSFDQLEDIDWKTVNNKLDKLRASSSEWLLNAVRSSNDN